MFFPINFTKGGMQELWGGAIGLQQREKHNPFSVISSKKQISEAGLVVGGAHSWSLKSMPKAFSYVTSIHNLHLHRSLMIKKHTRKYIPIKKY